MAGCGIPSGMRRIQPLLHCIKLWPQGKFTGARNIGFKNHAQTFFPLNTEYHRDSAWAHFLHHGYIRDYKHTIDEHANEEGLAL